MDARGRTYYVDHNSRTTSWQRPTTESVNNYNQWRTNQERHVSAEREQYQQRYLLLVSWIVKFIQKVPRSFKKTQRHELLSFFYEVANIFVDLLL